MGVCPTAPGMMISGMRDQPKSLRTLASSSTMRRCSSVVATATSFDSSTLLIDDTSILGFRGAGAVRVTALRVALALRFVAGDFALRPVRLGPPFCLRLSE